MTRFFDAPMPSSEHPSLRDAASRDHCDEYDLRHAGHERRDTRRPSPTLTTALFWDTDQSNQHDGNGEEVLPASYLPKTFY